MTKEQWEKCNCVCARVFSIATNNLTIVYHSVESVKNIDQQLVVNPSINVRDNEKKAENVALSIEDSNIKLSRSKTIDNNDKLTDNKDSTTKSTKTSSKHFNCNNQPHLNRKKTTYDITNYEAALELVKAVGEYKGNIIEKNENRF